MKNLFFIFCVAIGLILLNQSGCSGPVEISGGGKVEPHVTVLVANTTAGPTPPDKTVEIKGYGHFTGQIKVEGAFTALPPVVTIGKQGVDKVCSQKEVPDEMVVVGPDGGLANVFVYLKKVPGGEIPPVPSDPVVLDQVGCKSLPHAAMVRTGQALLLKNSDPLGHNTKLSGQNKNFNKLLSPNDQKGEEVKFERPENLPAKVNCDIHAWMSGWVLPLNHPWGAVTGEDGSFEIKGVPATDVQFVIWHEKLGYIERQLKIKIEADKTHSQVFKVDATKLK